MTVVREVVRGGAAKHENLGDRPLIIEMPDVRQATSDDFVDVAVVVKGAALHLCLTKKKKQRGEKTEFKS